MQHRPWKGKPTQGDAAVQYDGELEAATGDEPGKRRWMRLRDEWLVACRSRDLGRSRPLARTIVGLPLVLFRDGDGAPAALVDRCAHRNVPLSLGRCVGGALECVYHGWQYDRSGVCRLVPGLLSADSAPNARVDAHRVIEQQGWVWVAFGSPPPEREPYTLPQVDRPGYATVRIDATVEADWIAAAENILDVLHTAYLHRGLFRGGARHPVTAVVRQSAERIEVEYLGEPRPTGLAARILAPSGGVVEHVDRFVAPAIAEVEYRLGDDAHLVVTTALTPSEEQRTDLHTVVSFRSPLPAAATRLAVEPLARWILRQDAGILRSQSATIRRFGRRRFASTELDFFGPAIERLLLRRRDPARSEEEIPAERRLELTI